jgi:tetrahydromethanopterin S-methyltransferase subunit G
MKQIKLDVQYLGTIGVFVCTLVGFYYTTSYRLDELEKKVEVLETNSEAVIRLEERLKNVQQKTDEIYKHIIDFISNS